MILVLKTKGVAKYAGQHEKYATITTTALVCYNYSHNIVSRGWSLCDRLLDWMDHSSDPAGPVCSYNMLISIVCKEDTDYLDLYLSKIMPTKIQMILMYFNEEQSFYSYSAYFILYFGK